MDVDVVRYRPAALTPQGTVADIVYPNLFHFIFVFKQDIIFKLLFLVL